MAGKKGSIEYGLLVAPLGIGDTDTTISKKSFFERMEAQYPYKEGWRVTERNTIPSGTGVIITYHLEKVNE